MAGAAEAVAAPFDKTSDRTKAHQYSTASNSARGGQTSSRAMGSTEGTSSSSKGVSSRVQHAGAAAGPTGKSGTHSDSLVLSKTKTLTWRALSLGGPCPLSFGGDPRDEGLEFLCRPGKALTTAEWEDRLSIEQGTQGLIWIEVQDENHLAQGIAENLEVHTHWGSFLVRFPGHLSTGDVSLLLNGLIGERAAFTLDGCCATATVWARGPL